MGDIHEAQAKLCRHCKCTIHKDATYCAECHLYQDHRRFVWFGTTTLSLLIALITVIGFVSPKVAKALYPPADSLQIQLLECGNGGGVVTLVVSNTGERAGAIRSIVIYRGAPNTTPTGLFWPLHLMTPTSIVKAGESIEFVGASFRVLPDRVGFESSNGAPWHLVVEVMRASGVVEQRIIEFCATSDVNVGIPHPSIILGSFEIGQYPHDPVDGDGTTTDGLPAEMFVEFTATPRHDLRGIEIAYVEIDGERADNFHVYEQPLPVGYEQPAAVEYRPVGDPWRLERNALFLVTIPDGSRSKIAQGETALLVVRGREGEELGRMEIHRD